MSYKRKHLAAVRRKFKITAADLAEARKIVNAIAEVEERWRKSPEFYRWVRSSFRVIEGGRHGDTA